MPNGGFGCAYCVFYTKSFCNLRSARITTDHWTVCANVTYPVGDPLITDTFTRIGGMHVGGTVVKGSIYAITSDEGAYAQIPWLEDGEIHVVNSMRSCVVCQKSQVKGKGIAWRGSEYFFCSYAHYLSWRNQRIVENQIKAELSSDETLKYFYDYRDLKIINENTTEEQRQQANKRSAEVEAEEETGEKGLVIKAVGFVLLLQFLIFLFNVVFN